ncbi:MAG TPA: hypothetical protein DEQ27_03590 [Prevotella sp.]|nr:hypothetical protein [Prevotella sp.]
MFHPQRYSLQLPACQCQHRFQR